MKKKRAYWKGYKKIFKTPRTLSCRLLIPSWYNEGKKSLGSIAKVLQSFLLLPCPLKKKAQPGNLWFPWMYSTCLPLSLLSCGSQHKGPVEAWKKWPSLGWTRAHRSLIHKWCAEKWPISEVTQMFGIWVIPRFLLQWFSNLVVWFLHCKKRGTD